MATTKILLREDFENIGGRGEIVTVKAGYARNYLIPRGYALLATKGNIKQVEQERTHLLKKAAVEQSTAEAQREQMIDISLSFERKVGETGQLFGSVTSIDITNALQQKGYEIDRRQVQLKDVIKETGDFTVPVRLYRDVILEVPVSVIPEGGEAEAKTDKKAKAESEETVETEVTAEMEENAAEETEISEDADETVEE